jgi:hypothetical protein
MLLAAVFVRRRSRATATSKSSSAQRTHSRAAAFIEHLSFAENRSREAIAAVYAVRFPHQQVHWERGLRPSPDSHHLIRGIAAEGHDHHQINVRIRRGRIGSIRSEQNNPLWLEFACQYPAVGLDLPKVHNTGTIPQWAGHLGMPKLKAWRRAFPPRAHAISLPLHDMSVSTLPGIDCCLKPFFGPATEAGTAL